MRKLDDFEPWLRQNTTLGETTILLTVRTIKRFLKEEKEITAENINAFISQASRERHSPHVKYAFKHYLRFINKKKLYADLVGVQKRPRKKISRYFKDHQVKELIATISNQLYRTWATLQYATAARAFEIIGLQEEALDMESQDVRVLIKGKRGKTRYTFISAKHRPLLDLYLRGRPGFLFLPDDLNNANEATIKRHINGQRDQYYLSIQQAANKLNMGNFGTHGFRRNALELMRQAGADIRTIQRIAGHGSMDTTAQYFDDNPILHKYTILEHQNRG